MASGKIFNQEPVKIDIFLCTYRIFDVVDEFESGDVDDDDEADDEDTPAELDDEDGLVRVFDENILIFCESCL